VTGSFGGQFCAAGHPELTEAHPHERLQRQGRPAVTSWPRTLLRIRRHTYRKPARPIGNAPRSRLSPPFRGRSRDRRHPEHPAAELADAAAPVAGRDGRPDQRHTSRVADRLPCDEERIRRWESGEVRWPSPPYRRALKELTGLEPDQLGFTTSGRTAQPPARIEAADAFRSEAELAGTLDLARMVTSSDLDQGTLDALQEAAELLCRAYPSVSAGELRARTKAAAPLHLPAAARADHLGQDEPHRHPVDTPHPHRASIPAGALRRHAPKVGAQCGNPARWDLRVGPPARAVPTATRS
jgi:hypothetical protein